MCCASPRPKAHWPTIRRWPPMSPAPPRGMLLARRWPTTWPIGWPPMRRASRVNPPESSVGLAHADQCHGRQQNQRSAVIADGNGQPRNTCRYAGEYRGNAEEIGRAHVGTPVTNAHLVCRLLLEKKNKQQI